MTESTSTPRPDAAEQDVAATAGLRRLVTHARDQLRATTAAPPLTDWAYHSERWTAGKVRAYAAQLLVEQILTLVLDCLPAADLIPAEGVRELTAEHDRLAATFRAQVAHMERTVATLRDELDATVAAQAETETALDRAEERWAEAAELAQTDVPAAIRVLLADDDDESTVDGAS